MFNYVILDVEARVGTITLNQAERRNPLSIGMMTELIEAFESCENNPEVSAVMLTGSGSAFCAGADLTGFENAPVGDRREFSSAYTKMCLTMARLSKPIVGAVNGYCLAGGMGLAGSCDLLVAAEDARFGVPEVKIGLWPYMVMAVLFRSVGRKKGLELIMLGDQIDAPEAQRIGFVNRIVPKDQLTNEAQAIAKKIAGYSPVALRMGRQAFYAMADMTLEQGLLYAKEMLCLAQMTEDGQEGPKAFLEKRKPQWRGR